mmetsp:Transcript_46066/g.114289  ORF Transcript_46066/g.114289 Transcript_46066/m.114289 type:complete len:94 (-) Transcript_46066:407-688(-)
MGDLVALFGMLDCPLARSVCDFFAAFVGEDLLAGRDLVEPFNGALATGCTGTAKLPLFVPCFSFVWGEAQHTGKANLGGVFLAIGAVAGARSG